MPNPHRSEITRILQAAGGDLDQRAAGRVFDVLYAELRELASRLMRGERPGHTLRPTALVHEAYLKLCDAALPAAGRTHFFGIAARAMRQVLVDHARRRDAGKRGGARKRVTLSDELAGETDRAFEILEIEDALTRFAAVDPRAARVVELRLFGGFTHQETAQLLGISPRTAEADWAMGRMWLSRELEGPSR